MRKDTMNLQSGTNDPTTTDQGNQPTQGPQLSDVTQVQSSEQPSPYASPQMQAPSGAMPTQTTQTAVKQPVYKKVWFWIVIAVVVIGLIGAATGASNNNTASNSTADSSTNSTNVTNNAEIVESIQATYTGSNQAGTAINESTPGISVIAYFDDDTNQEITSGWTISNPATLEDGKTYDFTVEYEGKTASFTIEVPAALTRDNSSSKATTLGAGTFTVGKDVQPGRYVITAVSGSGNFTVTNPDGSLWVNEILGNTGMSGMGVPSITSDLGEGDLIEISGISQVNFTPATTKKSTTLTTGDWVVGVDIPAGSYVATPADASTSGNFQVLTSDGTIATNEILGDAGGFGVSNVTVNLSQGDVILISSIPTVNFKAR
jgi:hypothetical protein